jgi:hypothetical protein
MAPLSLWRFASACVEAYGTEAAHVLRSGRAPESELGSEIEHTYEATFSLVPETYRFTVAEMLEMTRGPPPAFHLGQLSMAEPPWCRAEAAEDYLEGHIVPAIEAELTKTECLVVFRAIQVAMMARSRNGVHELTPFAAHLATLPDVVLQLVAETELAAYKRRRAEHDARCDEETADALAKHTALEAELTSYFWSEAALGH